jgi:hypothetical protein
MKLNADGCLLILSQSDAVFLSVMAHHQRSSSAALPNNRGP